MTQKPEETWSQFLAPFLEGKPEKSITITLACISEAAGATILDTVEPAKCKLKPRELEARFLTGARSHCEAMASPQRYTCAVTRGVGVIGQRFLRLAPLNSIGLGGEGDGFNGDAIGPAMMKSGLRHIERMQQLHSRAAEGMLLNLAHVVEGQQQELRRYRAQDVERVELIQDLLDRKAERHIANEAADREQSRLDQGFEQLGNVGKLLVARLSGAEPASVLMRKLPLEQIGPMLDGLDDEGREAVRELLTQATEAEQARRGLLQLSAPAAVPSSTSSTSSAEPSSGSHEGEAA